MRIHPHRWLAATLLLVLTTALAASAEISEGLSGFFPNGLLDAQGQDVSIDALSGKKVVGVYFSASWCGPCRKFTPELVKYHAKNRDNFEVVFVSSDKDEEAQFAYMKKAEMKWPTVKHKSEAAAALKKKYSVTGIPTLVLVNAEGKTITRDGRSMVNDGVPADKLARAKIVEEEYTCSSCDKVHKRSKVVFADEEN